jgi:hypothetical protein
MKVHVLYEKDDGIWRIVRKKVKGNEIVLSRKRRVITNEKYRHGLPKMGMLEDQDYADLSVMTSKPRFRVPKMPRTEVVEERVPIEACMQDDEDCRPITFMYKSMAGRMTGLPLWRTGPLYKATYKSHKIQPFGKNTLIPMDPKLYKEMSENDTLHELLKRDNSMAALVYMVLGLGMGIMAGYILAPVMTNYLQPPAQVSNTTVRVVKGAILLWILPNVRMLLKGRRPQTPSVK